MQVLEVQLFRLIRNTFSKLKKSKAPLPLAAFCFLLMVVLVFVFYTTPLRTQVENKLYDIRTVIKPEVNDFQKIAIVEIDEKSIAKLTGGRQKDIGYNELEQIIDQLNHFNVRAIVVMLYPNVFDYTDEMATGFSERMSHVDNLYFGVLGLDTPVPSGRDVPSRLKSIQSKTFGLEIFRERRHDFVRQLNFYAYRGTEKRPLLPLKLAQEISGKDIFHSGDEIQSLYWLNYIDPRLLYRVPAETVVDDEVGPILRQQLSGRVVFVGYTVYRNRPINSNQIFVNTPWQSEGEDPEAGMPLVYVTAMAFANQLYNSWLKVSLDFVPILQTVIVLAFSLLVWTLGISRAIFLFITCWIALLYFHALFFAYGNISIPLADTALFSAIGVLSGSIWRLQIEGRLNLSKEAKALSLKQLAKEQSEFLLDFTHELSHMNRAVIEKLHDISVYIKENTSHQKLVSKIQAAAEDFRDYLRGMAEFAGLEDGLAKKNKRKLVNVRAMTQRILQQFAYRCQEQQVEVVLNIPQNFKIHTDETLLEPIVFNLISNAIKYSPNNSMVTVEANHNARYGSYLTVIDKGPGIPEEYHRRIFKKFYRVTQSSNYKVKGSGLGLYLSKYLAKRLGVSILVESKQDQGAKFTIRFKEE